MRLVSFLIFSLSICFINKSISQEYERVNGLWNATFVDLPISKKISFRTEFHSRTISYFGIWDQQLLRPQFSYKSSKNVSWRAGYTFIKNFDQDKMADPRLRREHNIWEQVEFTAPLNKSSFRTWIRLEHRFQENLPLQKNTILKTSNNYLINRLWNTIIFYKI